MKCLFLQAIKLLCFLIISFDQVLIRCAGFGTGSSSHSSEQVLDTSFPIIIGENRDQDDNSIQFSGSHFGYTVALAEGKSGIEKSSQDPDGWLFIGAPKSNATSSMYKSSPQPVEPGVIWRCSLGRPNGDTCEMVNIDPSSDKRRPSSPIIESHSGAWVGASLEIQHDHFITCGMRWNRGNIFHNGICYWFADKPLVQSRSSFRDRDLSKLVDRTSYDHRLMTFFRQGLDDDRLFFFNSSKNTNSSGHEWQISQGGVSLHIFQEGSSMPNVLIGAPGVREWGGAVALYTNTLKPNEKQARPNRNKNDPTFSEFLIGNRAPIPTPDTMGNRSFWNEYFGYAVTSGRYFQKERILYASGAPRAHHTGEVVIFDFPPHHQWDNNTYKRDITSLVEIQAPLNSFASYFGSVLHSVDLDEDGLDELIVGAPLYTFSSVVRNTRDSGNKDVKEIREKDDEENGMMSGKTKREKPKYHEDFGDHGCVFIYRFNMSQMAGSQENATKHAGHQPSQFLVGSKTPNSRFGSAISSMKFNLKNGTRELYLVIGAPYEPLDEDSIRTGAVYIYLFNKKQKKFPNFIQRITASSIDEKINGFGTSLSIPKDIDHNNTPDLAIGSYKSGTAVVLRTRPKILLKSWIKFVSFEGKEVQELKRGSHQFYLKSCFSVFENLGLVDIRLNIWVKVRFSDKTIHFHEDLVIMRQGNTRNEIIYMRTVDAHTTESCENLTVVADHKDGIGMDDSDILKEIPHPFHFFQEVKYNETLDKPLTPRKYYAYGGGHTGSEFSQFGSRMPSSQISRIGEDLRVSFLDCRDPVCRPEIHFSWTYLNDNNETISTFILGSSKEVTVRLNISNHGETAAKPGLTLDWNLTEITESSSGGRWLERSCPNKRSEDMLRFYGCPLGLYIKKGRSLSLDLRLNMDEIFVGGPENLKLVLNASVIFEDPHIKRFNDIGVLPIYVPDTKVVLMGSRENDSTLRTPFNYKSSNDLQKKDENGNEEKETALYSSFRQRFTVQLQGASVRKVTAMFKIPLFDHFVDLITGPLLLVKQPQLNSDSIHCETTSNQHGFHSIKLIDDLPPILGGGGGLTKDPNFEFDNMGQGHHFGRAVDKYLILKPNFRTKRFVPETNISDININTNTTDHDLEPVPPTVAIDMRHQNKVSKEDKLPLPENALKLMCDSEGDCLEVKCTITNLRGKTHAHIPFEIYPVKDAIDKLLQTSQKTALFIETKGYAQIFQDGGPHVDHDVAQTVLIKISGKEVELWVYIAAGVGGIILLILIILGLYKCGFFKREKRQQLNQMKAEHHRKSMIAQARASMMQGGSMMGTLQDYESLQTLTEAEQTDVDLDSENSDEKEIKPKSKRSVKIKE